jgi:GNAT superfamily N-acetyltransferase
MDAAQRIARNLADTMTCFGHTEPAALLDDRDGVRIIDVGLDLRVFNTAVMTEPATDEAAFRTRIAAAQRHFSERNLPWSLWICDALMPPGLARLTAGIALDYGLRRNSVTPGMIAASITPGPEVQGLAIRRIADAQTRSSFCRILSRTFEGPSDQLTHMYGRTALWTADFRGYVGSMEGKDVCAGFAVAAAGVLGIYALATLPPYARRGCASALVRHAAAESRSLDGNIPLVLQATETGVRLYERLGFHRVAEFSLYCST